MPFRVQVARSMLLLGSASGALAQCEVAGLPGLGCNGVYGQYTSLRTWDPDGPGAAPPQVIVAGAFTIAGDVQATGIATWDPVSHAWSPLDGPTGLWRSVADAIPLTTGELVVAGKFPEPGGSLVNGIAAWDGASWADLGSGLTMGTAGVRALVTLPNGDLVAGGNFGLALPSPWGGVARWDGSIWSALPGLTGDIYCLAVRANGDLVVAGSFGLGGVVTHTDSIAVWSNGGWTSLAVGIDGRVECLCELPNGELVAGGTFTSIGGVQAYRVARWNGSVWSAMAGGMNGHVDALATLPNGDLVVGGAFTTAGSLVTRYAARWSGAGWAPLGDGPGWRIGVLLTLANGELLAGRGSGAVLAGSGEWSDAISEIARWDGSSWSSLMPSGPVDIVADMAPLPGGGVVACGRFTRANGTAVGRVARWDGTSWSPLGPGMNDHVGRVLVMPDGGVIAAGTFTVAGWVAAHNLARWDGTAWSALGGVPYEWHRPLLCLPDGDLVVATTAAPYLYRWDGAQWTPFSPAPVAPIGVLAVLSNGNLAVAHDPVFVIPPGGWLSVPTTTLELWDGASWQPLGTVAGMCGLRALPDDSLVASGMFTQIDSVAASGLARWDGASWAALPPTDGMVSDVGQLPDGDIVVGGLFTSAGGVPANNLARWNGATWSAIGAGADWLVNRVLVLPDGGLLLGGAFGRIDQEISPFFGEMRTTCPASASTFAAGCASSGGDDVLSVTSLPWVDTTFRATGTGLPMNAFVLALFSFAPIVPGVPLASALPQGGVGCDVHVQPDIVQTLFTSDGTATSSHFLLDTPPLAGMVFHHQMIPVEIDANGAIVEITATNALRLTAGTF